MTLEPRPTAQPGSTDPQQGAPLDLSSARRQLALDTLGIAVSVAGFGLVFGLAARGAGYSPLEASAMSVFAFAGAAQFAAVGYVAAGLPWLPILVLTFALNARHLLYSASLAPALRGQPRATRAAMAHVLTDEAFALAAAHFHRLGRVDVTGYWIGAVVGVFIPWNIATLAGVLLGGAIPDPAAFGLDIVFPAAMAGLAAGLATGRRELTAAGAGAALGVIASLAFGPSVGVIAGGLVGPLVGMSVPAGGMRLVEESDTSAHAIDIELAMADALSFGNPPVNDVEPGAEPEPSPPAGPPSGGRADGAGEPQ